MKGLFIPRANIWLMIFICYKSNAIAMAFLPGLSGHFKTGQRWSGQKPASGCGPEQSPFILFSPGQASLFLFSSFMVHISEYGLPEICDFEPLSRTICQRVC
jgi:hypothetical protein